jgi:hypothetical protein
MHELPAASLSAVNNGDQHIVRSWDEQAHDIGGQQQQTPPVTGLRIDFLVTFSTTSTAAPHKMRRGPRGGLPAANTCLGRAGADPLAVD